MQKLLPKEARAVLDALENTGVDYWHRYRLRIVPPTKV